MSSGAEALVSVAVKGLITENNSTIIIMSNMRFFNLSPLIVFWTQNADQALNQLFISS